MKIREGFVSNSSSSSFIINIGEKYPNVFELAKTMIPARDGYKDNKKLISILNESSLDKNTGVFFRSCNYDTFIIKRDNEMYVNTCNNHMWNEYIDSSEYNRDKSKTIDYDSSFNFNNEVFWFIEKNKFIKNIDVYNNEALINKEHYCSMCGVEVFELNGEICCPICETSIDDLTFVRDWRYTEFDKLQNKLVKMNKNVSGHDTNFSIDNFIFKLKKGKILVYQNDKKFKCNIRKSDDVINLLISQKIKSIKNI